MRRLIFVIDQKVLLNFWGGRWGGTSNVVTLGHYTVLIRPWPVYSSRALGRRLCQLCTFRGNVLPSASSGARGEESNTTSTHSKHSMKDVWVSLRLQHHHLHPGALMLGDLTHLNLALFSYEQTSGLFWPLVWLCASASFPTWTNTIVIHSK